MWAWEQCIFYCLNLILSSLIPMFPYRFFHLHDLSIVKCGLLKSLAIIFLLSISPSISVCFIYLGAPMLWLRLCLQCRRPTFDPWFRRFPWRRGWLSTPVFLPRESHGQRSLGGYSPWGCEESAVTVWPTLALSRPFASGRGLLLPPRFWAQRSLLGRTESRDGLLSALHMAHSQ